LCGENRSPAQCDTRGEDAGAHAASQSCGRA
jgi:hypothetical protein